LDLDLGWDGGEGKSTSAAVTVSAAQSTLGKTLYINLGFSSMVSETSSHSFGWRGKEAEVDLQALTAQVRKLRVRTFIFFFEERCVWRCGGGGWCLRRGSVWFFVVQQEVARKTWYGEERGKFDVGGWRGNFFCGVADKIRLD